MLESWGGCKVDTTTAPNVDDKKLSKGISLRSIIIGAILAICHTCWIIYEETALGHILFTYYMLIHSVIAILFFMLVVNSVLGRLKPSWKFTPAELMVIYSMTTISAAISGYDLLQNLIPNLLWPYYYGTPVDGFEPLLRGVPSYFAPKDPAVIKEFFYGSGFFWRFFHPDVFRAWAVPLAVWAGFLFTIAFTMLCLNSILRKQWVDNEKLSFPIIELPLAMARKNTAGAFFRDPLFVAGFAITTVVLSMNSLSFVFPSIPGVHLNITNIGARSLLTPPWSTMNPVFVAWWPFAFGLCYLIPLDVSFSSWFFYVLIRLSMVFVVAMGWQEPGGWFASNKYPYWISISNGAWMGMFGLLMWNARSHISTVLRAAFRGEKVAGEEHELMPYRTAARLAVIGILILVGFTVYSGVRLQVALAFFGIYFLISIVMTRIYAQVSLPIFELYHLNTSAFLTSFTGVNSLNSHEITVLGHFHWFNRCYRQHPMGHEMEAVYFAEQTRSRLRSMSTVIVIALAIGIVVGLLTTMQIYYHRGAVMSKVTGVQMGIGGEAWRIVQARVRNPESPQLYAYGAALASIAVVTLLAVMRNMWFGFPLHPVGYALACCYSMEYIWAVTAVTWLVKLLIIRYGGLQLYRRSLSFFFGLIVGDAVSQVVWGLALGALGIQNASPYLELRFL